jgi:hypothetical protein
MKTHFTIHFKTREIEIINDVSKFIIDPDRPFLSLRTDGEDGSFTWHNYNLEDILKWYQENTEK